MRSVFRQFRDTVTARARRRKAGHADDAGLTLVEMIVVLAIIALVAGLLVGSGILNRPDQARVTTAKTDMATLSSALKLYRLDNGGYPTTQQGLKALVERPTTPPIPSSWNPEGYVAEDPVDPWGNPYVYSATSAGFELKSLGKDGKPGGEGLDADLSAGR